MTVWINPHTGLVTGIPDGWVPQGTGGFFIKTPLWAIYGSEPAKPADWALEGYVRSFISQRSHRFSHAHTETSADGETLFLVGTVADHGFAATFVIRKIGESFCSIDYQDSSIRHAARCDDPALSEALFSTGGAK